MTQCRNGCAHDVETALIEALDEALEETAQTMVTALDDVIAAIVLCGMGMESGIDPTLRDTPCGQAAIKEGLDQRDIEEAAVRVATCSEAEMADALARLREALRAAGRVGGE